MERWEQNPFTETGTKLRPYFIPLPEETIITDRSHFDDLRLYGPHNVEKIWDSISCHNIYHPPLPSKRSPRHKAADEWNGTNYPTKPDIDAGKSGNSELLGIDSNLSEPDILPITPERNGSDEGEGLPRISTEL